MAQALFNMATRQNNVAVAIFWMKARGGWREKHEVDATVKGEPIGLGVVFRVAHVGS
ncbi:hypothetical protein [Roseomonas fluvialis]|uniref:Uncharacterized protein n=1 Tax=Roseomonas fluvialis TaxID=1750527 RepID=A0ABN6P5U2_9PROT|nr:hypothetical protein [Roseomonas fluvialis]BDG74019.1 hypothetical protein Rmf_39480 [Roseomonas fluvialis]